MNLSSFLSNVKGFGKKNIFISYRVSDTAGETGRLVDSLKQHFPEEQIFMDIEKIEPGVDFTQAIARSLEACDVLLAVIGPNWIGTDHNKKPRINQPNDWVRLEIATALQRNIRVVPVLVDGASLPEPEQLPDDLQPLLKRQAYELSNKRWKYDTDQLIAYLEKILGVSAKKIDILKPSKFSKSWKIIVGALAGVGAVVIMVVAGEFQESNNYTPINYNNQPTQNSMSQPNNVVETDNSTEQTTTDSYSNVAGTWMDANGLYYLVLYQNGSNVTAQSFSPTGVATGQGSGSVSNDNLQLTIFITGYGNIAINANVAGNGAQLVGTTNITNNGYSYSEPLRLNKRY